MKDDHEELLEDLERWAKATILSGYRSVEPGARSVTKTLIDAHQALRALIDPPDDFTYQTGYLVHWLEPIPKGRQHTGSMKQACLERRPGPNPVTPELGRVTCRACRRIAELLAQVEELTGSRLSR